MKNNIFPIKERTMDFFERENIYDELIKMLKNDKSLSVTLYFKDIKTVADFIQNHISDIEYINDDFSKELSLNEIIESINNEDYTKIILNEPNEFISFSVAIDKKGFYLENGDLMIVPTISYFVNTVNTIFNK